ncbi:hypothetical protein RB601_009256 [Gaeumannomyces tritici]
MTRDIHLRASEPQDADDPDLLAGLWETAAFPRLPRDAPSVLQDLVEDVENPRRVFTIHRASRRHNFQVLVQKFVVQLRDGCGSPTCETPICFSFRKRSLGRVPIRRYNTTSARTIAVFLASQDNPESALCPSLRPPKTAPAALEFLHFATRRQNGYARSLHPKAYPGAAPRDARQGPAREGIREGATPGEAAHENMRARRAPAKFTVEEKHVNKDPRSFAANMFGTVAFKMLEWLTPASMDEMSRKAREFHGQPPPGRSRAMARESRSILPRTSLDNSQTERDTKPLGSAHNGYVPGVQDAKPPSTVASASVSAANSACTSTTTSSSTSSSSPPPSATGKPPGDHRTADPNSDKSKGDKSVSMNSHPAPQSRPSSQRRNSNARVRTSSTAKSKRNLSIDAFSSEQGATEDLFSTLKSPRLPNLAQEKGARPSLKPATSAIPRPISQLSNSGILDGVPLETMPPLKYSAAGESRPKPGRGQSDGNEGARADSHERLVHSPEASSSSDKSFCEASQSEVDEAFERAYKAFLPQSLSRLNPEIVDLFCDILQDDGTAESHLFEPRYVMRSDPVREGVSHRTKSLQRKMPTPIPYPADLHYRWMMFVEQTFFYVLSDPRRLIKSFTKKGQLFDSQTLWYCMLRMSRVAPTVVIHSLWMAAEALFIPPKSVQSLRSPNARLFPKQDNTLSDAEAGALLSICLHLLIAVAPVTLRKEELQDMSRIRSHGLILARTGAVARQTAKLCLAYNDALSNDLAIRLARRLFSAIPTREYYSQMAAANMVSADGQPEEYEILTPLFQQLDFLNADTLHGLLFTIQNRAVHEIRAPTLLLDWARNIMLLEWDGQPEVPGDGPFGGALALIKAMYHKRRLLVLADGQFRADYFAERLDEVEVPVSWLSFKSSKHRLHLLDFPYIFSPSKLVSYFRSINFSRMSRSFEESSSLQERMNAIIPPRGNLIINPHHKHVLQDMLKAASSKYLVLSIRRDSVLMDTFDQLWRREERELMRPLKVKLGEETGEEGFDSGGVQQEFFRMAMAEALDPDFGLFTVDERTRMTWFNPASPEPDFKFELIGLLFSLAVYNGLTLPVTFPEALYCKLLGEPVTDLHHISDGWPDLASGLTTLLDWDEKDGAVEDVFSRTYEFSISVFGEPVSREMKSGGEARWPSFPSKHAFGGVSSASASVPLQDGNPQDAPLVTRENRNAYVADYIRYLTDVSVRPQFEAFARGFRTCLGAKALTLLTPRLLRSVVEGVQEIEVSELRRHARYVGWDASHRTVRDFWSIVKKFDGGMRRKLLEFVTASDRVPVGGMKNLQFVVQRNGEEEGDGGHLPTAYTCYGTLLLPQYRDKEVLRERLCMALENAQGFGFA